MSYIAPEFNAPIHTHDCDCCTYLGSDHAFFAPETFDFYLCKGIEETLIARYGSEPQENISLPTECCCNKIDHPLGRAKQIAQHKRLI